MTDQPSGFSGTPIIKKLGIKPGFFVRVVNAPADYRSLLGPLPTNVHVFFDAERNSDKHHKLRRMDFSTLNSKIMSIFWAA